MSEQDLANLTNPNVVVQAKAVENVGKPPSLLFSLMGPIVSKENERRAIAALVALLQDKRQAKEVELSILRSLGDLSKRSEVPLEPLIARLKDADPEIRNRAIEALGKTGNQGAAPLLVKLLPEDTDKYPVIWALGEVGGPDAMQALNQLVSSEDSFLRYNAHRALAKIGMEGGSAASAEAGNEAGLAALLAEAFRQYQSAVWSYFLSIKGSG